MVSWPGGHRWEDHTIEVLDASEALLGTLAEVHNFKGKTRLFGQYKASVQFDLSADDPWASVLNEDEMHYIIIYRDGVRIWSGVQVTDKREQDETEAKSEIHFEFLPASHVARWRFGMPIPPGTALNTGPMKLDDGMKWVMERTFGATAPATPTTAISRVWTNFVIAADKTEYPDDYDLVATYSNIYDLFMHIGSGMEVDWDIFFNDDRHLEFETWYPYRGTDRTSGNGAVPEVIFTDTNGTFTRSTYQRNSDDMVTVVYDMLMASDVAAVAGTRNKWGLRDLVVKSQDDLEVTAALGEHDLKISVKLEDFVELPNCQWDPGGTATIGFDVGDKVTWQSNGMGYGPINDTVCGIDWDFDEDGWEHLVVLLGDPVPDIIDKMKGGGKGRWTGDDTGTRLPWGLRDDNQAEAYPPALANTIQITGINGVTVELGDSDQLVVDGSGVLISNFGATGDTGAGAIPNGDSEIAWLGGGTTYNFDAHDNQLDFTGPWTRADAGSADYYLRQTNYLDDIRLQSAEDTDEIWLEGSTGKSHFGDDMYIGNAAGVEDVRLTIYDTRAFSGLHAWNGAVGYTKFGTISSGITVIDNEAGASISFQCGGAESLHLHGDLEWASFRNGVSVLGSPNSDGSGAVWTLNSDTGNLYLDPAATTTLGNYVYTWPLADLADGNALGVVGISGSAVTLGGIDVSALGYWTRYDYGEIDQAIRPSVDDDSIHTRESITSAVTMRVEGASGKSWFMSDMAVGAVESTPADPSTLFTHGAKLHVIDEARNGAWAQFLHDTNSAQFGVANDGKAFMNTAQATGLSFQTNSTQRAVVKDDGSEWSFEGGIDLKGYAATNSGTEKWFIDSTQGNVWLDEAATTTFGAYTYTWPTSGGAEDDVLTISGLSGTAATLSWDDPSTLPLWGGYWQRNGIILSPTTSGDDVQVGSSIFLDNSTGYARATRLEVAGATEYIHKPSAGRLRMVAGTDIILWGGGGANAAYLSSSEFSSTPSGSITLGSSSLKWGNVHTAGDVIIYTAGKGIVMDDNSTNQVLGGTGSRYVPSDLAITGHTGNWYTVGSPVWTPVYAGQGTGYAIIGYFPYYQHYHYSTTNGGNLAITVTAV